MQVCIALPASPNHFPACILEPDSIGQSGNTWSLGTDRSSNIGYGIGSPAWTRYKPRTAILSTAKAKSKPGPFCQALAILFE